MLDPKIRESLENQVRPILQRFSSRVERTDATRLRSAMGPLLDMLRSGRGPAGIDVSRVSVPSDVELWILGVYAALAYVGKVPAYVLVARLTRRQKSAERSWEQIENELFDLAPRWGQDIPSIPDMKQQYAMALPILAEVFDSLRISPEYREQNAA